MKKIKIIDWSKHGDYMLYASMVDRVGEWIMLESTSSYLIATGKESSLEKFGKLLTEKEIPFEKLKN